MNIARSVAGSLLAAVTLASMSSCNSTTPADNNPIESDSLVIGQDSLPGLVKINDVVFGIPSPYQFASFIKKASSKYNKSTLCPTSAASKQTTSFSRSLLLGIYGCDLAYVNMYEQLPDAVSYFATVKRLTSELGLQSAFDPALMKRIENNMGKQDSLLYILSNAYRHADSYLKDSERKDQAALVIAGGWVESLYVLTKVYEETANKDVLYRIAEQKHVLDGLTQILTPHYNTSKDYESLVNDLVDLAYDYDGVEYEYTYKAPTVDPKNKLTMINSESKLLLNKEQLKLISQKIAKLRARLID